MKPISYHFIHMVLYSASLLPLWTSHGLPGVICRLFSHFVCRCKRRYVKPTN